MLCTEFDENLNNFEVIVTKTFGWLFANMVYTENTWQMIHYSDSWNLAVTTNNNRWREQAVREAATIRPRPCNGSAHRQPWARMLTARLKLESTPEHHSHRWTVANLSSSRRLRLHVRQDVRINFFTLGIFGFGPPALPRQLLPTNANLFP